MDKRLDLMETVFKALADRTRLRILALLVGGETCVCHIHESLDIPQPKTSRHLAYLKRAGLLEDRKDGLWVYYRLAEPADEVVRTLLSSVNHCLGHLPTARGDRRRLERHTGRPISPLEPSTPQLACCAERGS